MMPMVKQTAFAIAAIGFTSAAFAEVLVPSGVGLKSAEHSRQLVAFQRKETTPKVVASSKTAIHTPKANVKAAIESVASRHAANAVLREVGLTPNEWAALFQANIEIESGYNPVAKSHVGAFGLGQLMPETARSLGVDMYDMHQNLDGSARYLLAMLDKFQKIDLALAAYNAGPGAVEKYSGVPPYNETKGHVSKVTRVFNRLKASKGI